MIDRTIWKDARHGKVLEVQRRLAQGEEVDQMDEHGDTPLIHAASNGKVNVVQVLLAHNASIEGKRSDRLSPLLRAIQKGSVDTTALLLERQANVEASFPDGKTPLIFAASHGVPGIVTLLLEHHANPDAQDEAGNTALILSAANGYPKVVEILLNATANANISNYERKTPLSAAAARGHVDVVQVLLSKETTDVDSFNEDGWTSLLYATDRGHLECVKVLLEHQAQVDACTSNGTNALILATKRGYHEIVRLLLRYHASIDVSVGGMTPLMLAASYGYVHILQMLLDANSNYDTTNADGKTPLDLAIEHNQWNCKTLLVLRQQHPFLYFARSGDLESVMEELDHADDVDERDESGMTALMYAAASGYIHVVRYLLQQGADIDVYDSNGATALSLATGDSRVVVEREILYRIIRNGKFAELVDLIKENRNMDIDQRDEDGTTLLIIAVEHGEAEMVKLLLDHNADLEACRHDGMTPLQLAIDGNHRGSRVYLEKEESFRENYPLLYHARSNNVKETRRLLEAGSNVDECDEDGWSALMYAASMDNVAVIQILLEYNASIGGSDKGGKTAFMVAPDKEAFVKLILNQSKSDLRFSELMFKGAIECDPKLGKAILDEFVIERGRYSLEFRELDRIYGKGQVQESALFSILHYQPVEAEAKEAVKQYCLQHPMIRRVLQLKWEFFAQRLYIEQFLMYVLLLVSSMISGSFYQLDESTRDLMKELSNIFNNNSVPFKQRTDNSTMGTDSDGFRWALNIWLLTLLYVIIAWFIAHYGLKPKRISTLAKWCRDGTYWGLIQFMISGNYTGLDWNQGIPDIKEWKNHAMKILFFHSIFWTFLFGIPLITYFGTRSDDNINEMKDLYQAFLNLMLWFVAAYFFRWEIKEMMGYGTKKYFSSLINSMQMLTFCVILFLYVPCQLQIIPEVYITRPVLLVLSGLTTLSLWVLFLQFLEIIPSAGYLLPMMKGLMRDLSRFSILYSVFQGGLTCCYYILFQGKHGHETFLKSFITVFFVLFGQLDDVIQVIEEEKGTKPLVYIVGYILVMFHCAAAIVLLLNVLIAMMNVTMQTGLENAKIEALVSYAHCILRLELSVEPQERQEMIYIIKPKFLKDDENDITWWQYIKKDELKPLVPKIKQEKIGILNPSFNEIGLKSDYIPLVEIPDESQLEFQNEIKMTLGMIKKQHTQQLDQLKLQISQLTKTIVEIQSKRFKETTSI